MITLDVTFPSEYEVSLLSERPSNDTSLRYFFPAGSRPQDGLLIQVTPVGGFRWQGMCSFGDFTYSGVLTHPDERMLLVVSRGICYLIDTVEPDNYNTFPTESALGAFSFGELSLIIIYSYRVIFALN